MSAERVELYRHPAELERQLRRVEPACRIVPERHLRRVARALGQDAESWNFQPQLPIWVERDQLAQWDIVRESVLEGEPGPRLLVVAADDRIGSGSFPSDADLLRDYWRLLFRGRLLWVMAPQPSPACTGDGVHRMMTWGEPAAREIRFVLESDDWIPDHASWDEVYRVFAVLYIDRAMFAPQTLPQFFPSLPPAEVVLPVLTHGLDVEQELAATRPHGAADPDSTLFHENEITQDELGLPIEFVLEDDQEPTRLRRRARRAEKVGNSVRAAILRMRLAQQTPGEDHARAEASAISTLRNGLVHRLRHILQWDSSTAKSWTLALAPLLIPATRGIWPRAARVLYDLQKIAVDLERDIFTVEPMEWLRTFGRQPLRRPLTRARHVILLQHLTTASRHLNRVNLPPTERQLLDRLLQAEIRRAEATTRSELGPVIRACLDDVGFHPHNLLEEIARDKLIAELLDRICERGFLRLGDLRDAIARNQCKIPDLQGPREFCTGDLLLRADERLAEELHGVYRRGEIYLRWIQRLTAVSFGTTVGRGITRFLAIPFGGAFLTVEFAKYLIHEVHTIRGALRASLPQRTPIEVGQSLPQQEIELPDLPIPKHESPIQAAEHAIHLTPTTMGIIIVLGFFIMGVIHSPPFRAFVLRKLVQGWSILAFLFKDLPLSIWRSPPLLAIRRSGITRFVNRYLGPGIIVGLGTSGYMVILGAETRVAWSWGWFTFAIVVLFTNSPTGRAASDWFEEALSDTWRQIRANLIPGILSWIQLLFRELAGIVERILYAVDERLRFRQGQTGESLIVKTILTALWFPIAYTVRFAFMLLLEPQINPVKHFPVVTVSHKLLLPLIPSTASATGLSTGTVTLIIGGIPGIFGFIVWELKENWRLYAANRTPHQPPVILGHHGETMRGLLRLGFHSGTIPRLYRRMRAAIAACETTHRPVSTTRLLHEFHEIEAAVTALGDREFVSLLRAARCWKNLTPSVHSSAFGVQQVILTFRIQEIENAELRIGWEHQNGQIIAQILQNEWSSHLTPEQHDVLVVGLTGLSEKTGATWASHAMESMATSGPTLWDDRVAFWESARTVPCPHGVQN
ncbi:MAG: hypothetical protein LC104_08175 [Bacteroidales bacterium]|nr:hypothetical protein [Bacteroidales bacterium]